MDNKDQCPSLAIPELREIPCGMLSSPQIALYFKHNFLVKNPGSGLKGATYDMRLGGPAYRFINGEKKIINLGEEDDTIRNIQNRLFLPPNSLTFVTTREEFRLTRDVIARFNLKSKWVHKGLLLGTGPIVDPEFDGFLYIPIHNFSGKEIDLEFDTPLIVVEFTKTLDVTENYIKNPSKKGIIANYLNSAGEVESSVLKVIREYEEKIQDNTDEINASKTEREKWNKRFTWGWVASAFLGGIALASLVFTTWSVHADTRQKVLAAHEALLTTSDRLEKENTRIRNELAVLKEQLRVLSTSSSGALTETKVQEPQGQLNTNALNAAQQDGPKAQPSPSSEEKTSTQK